MLTLKDIATTLAELDNRDAEVLHGQLRNPAIRGLFESIEEDRGRTSALRYPARELIRARVLAAIVDIGFDARVAAEVNRALIAEPKPGLGEHPADNIASDASGLGALIAGTGRGEDWELRVRITRKDGERRVVARLARADWRRGGSAAQIVDSAMGDTVIGELCVPASDLIRPLLETISEPT